MKQMVDQFVSYSVPLFKLQQWAVFDIQRTVHCDVFV